eukprot:scaffold1671_cov344-Pavlova_lutheri.AAC.21
MALGTVFAPKRTSRTSIAPCLFTSKAASSRTRIVDEIVFQLGPEFPGPSLALSWMGQGKGLGLSWFGQPGQTKP